MTGVGLSYLLCRMRIATWNLERVRPGAGVRSQRIRDAIAGIDPDVWVLTESHADFVPAPGYVRHAVSVDAPDPGGGERWVVIWLRAGVDAQPLAVTGEPERSAAVQINRPDRAPLLVFRTVLPWRGDKRLHEVRGGQAFARSLQLQATDWGAARAAVDNAELCIAGDFNQEFDADGPVGTRIGRAAFDETLEAIGVSCVTGGDHDPLLARGWRTNIDHILLNRGLRADATAEIWPEHFPLSGTLSDHHGICVRVVDA
jgi:endonuclease/exonuclease/phosphatase family metal-dependent hydrolase